MVKSTVIVANYCSGVCLTIELVVKCLLTEMFGYTMKQLYLQIIAA